MNIYKINDKLCRIVSFGAVLFCQCVSVEGKDIFYDVKTECGKGFCVQKGLFAVDKEGIISSNDKTKGIDQFLFKVI